MGRISVEDIDKYGNGNGTEFFKLADDGDKAVVRFYHKNLSDVEALAVHTINVDGRDRKISCLRDYDEPKSKCPLCSEGNFISTRLYITLLVYEPEKSGENKGLYLSQPSVQIWERGAGFKKQLQSIINRYCSDGKDLVNTVFEIERMGKKGDTNTQYGIYPVTEIDDDECPIPENVERPVALGTIVLDKNADEINEFLETGKFAEKKQSTSTAGTSSRRNSQPAAEEPEQPIRRRRTI